MRGALIPWVLLGIGGCRSVVQDIEGSSTLDDASTSIATETISLTDGTSTEWLVDDTNGDATTSDDPPVLACGNGVIDAWEQCDDGNRRNWDGCQWDCRLPLSLELSADAESTCVSDRGGIKCWGRDLEGRLGYGLTSAGECNSLGQDACVQNPACCTGDDETPAARSYSLTGIEYASVATGATTCALTAAQSLRCWGDGSKGQLGPDVYAQCGVRPSHIPGAPGNCDEPGCCVGDDESASEAIEIDLGGVEQVVQLIDVTCALLVGGDVRCWGSSEYGALGLGSTWDSRVGDDEEIDEAPLVDIGGKAVYLATGDAQTCALLDDGRVRCWGPCLQSVDLGTWTSYCLGLAIDPLDVVGDDESPSAFPTLSLAGPAVHVDISSSVGCAVLEDGRVHCWGSSGLVGNASTKGLENLLPSETEPLTFKAPAVRVEAGLNPCALLADGSVVCWGYGGPMNGTASTAEVTQAETAPAAVLGGSAVALVGGVGHRCVLREDLAVLCWGFSGAPTWPGRLGYGTLADIGDDETPASVGPVPIH